MQDEDVFLTLGEIAVAFAGFASIAILFRRRDRGAWEPADALRYRGMLANSLFACVFAFLPLILGRFDLSSLALWSSCSALLLTYAIYRAAANLPATFRMAAQRGERLPRDYSVSIASAALVILLQFGNIIGMPFGRGPAPYLAGVALLVAIAGINFFALVAVPKPTPE
jgi:hypothetical protein